jgi:hypothetical protein
LGRAKGRASRSGKKLMAVLVNLSPVKLGENYREVEAPAETFPTNQIFFSNAFFREVEAGMVKEC